VKAARLKAMRIPGNAISIIVVGDEILSGKRQDKHLAHVIEQVASRGIRLHSCHYASDELDELTLQIRQSREAGVPVLCFGGIGATPDDVTREAAAGAFSKPLERHPEAAELIIRQFGDDAYPRRILMADLPTGAKLIPNPVNNIPGFAVDQHYFLPGFPRMAWPMMEWVLDTYYADAGGGVVSEESVRVFEQRESDLIDLMEKLSARHSEVKIFSLPHMGDDPYIELGFRGDPEKVSQAFASLQEALEEGGITYQGQAPNRHTS
jgi:molybdopterin-biosynthesis enzyme MoeA-like protein